MANYRKHFANEDFRQESKFNVCMKSERASAGLAPGTFQLLRLFTNA